jgi:UDP-N-acetylmuramate dehydrogenase
LIADRGVKGAVLSLDRMAAVALRPGEIEAEAGAHLHRVVQVAAYGGLAGLEALVGIPGRVGGAVFGNAGSRYGSIGDRVRWLDLLEADGTLTRVVPDAAFFSYRRSRVGDRIVVRACLGGEPEAPPLLRARVRELLAERRRSQPGWVGNAGCVFKNPAGQSAGRLIDTAACKGMRAGDVVVSERHANFFENGGEGTECDVRRLVELVCDRVRRTHGVELEMEVRQWR